MLVTNSIGKSVDGNQGSKDKYFKFDITIANLGVNQKLLFDLNHATIGSITDVNATLVGTDSSNYSNQDNTTGLTAYTREGSESATTGLYTKSATSESLTYTCYLKNGEYITISGLPNGATYTVNEHNLDYTTHYYGDIEDITTGTTKDDLTQLQEYLNNRTVGSGMGEQKNTTTSGGTAYAESGYVGLSGTVERTTGKIVSDDLEFAFLNEKKGVIPTGIIMSVAPAVGLVLAGLIAAFAVAFGGKKRKDELEEE